ncbi:MAG TPA: CoA transferase, partial [Longimicrobiales bacterium]|nr:CoA transferase [Longimicrobiales bacterium]
MTQPLDGVRVLDLTQVMAGPFCTLLLADLGADVIKIEPPGSGDLSRSMGGEGLRMNGADNAPFLALNRNKRSVILDLKDAVDLRAFRELAASADVVVENFRPGVTRRLGIDYDTLSGLNPRIVYASISGFGQTGPYADRPGFDLIAQAMSGILSVTGTPGGEPVKCGVPISDLAAGLYGAVGVLAALAARASSGRGQHVETSLFEAALGLSVWETTEYWATDEVPRAWGSAHRLNAPYQAFRTADGSIVLAALTTGQWTSLCSALHRTELAADERFGTNEARMAHLPELVAEIETALAADSADAWVERLLAAGVPAAPLLDYAQVFADPHTQARRMIEEVDHPVEGTIRTLGFPLKMSATPLRVRRPPPLLGEHTAEVLAE